MRKKPLFFLNPTDTLLELQDYYFPPYITLAHMFNAPAGWAIKNRVLRQFQLQYVVDGAAQYTIEGHRYDTCKGDLVIHRPGERHQVSTLPDKPYICLSIVFHFGTSQFPLDDLISTTNYLGNFNNTDTEKKLTALVVHYRQLGLVHQLHAQTLLMDILLQLNRMAGDRINDSATPSQRSNTSKMVLIRKYITEHYDRNIQICDLERLSGLGHDYLIVQFKRAFQMTPVQYLIHVRIEKAKELAVNEGLTPGEIAYRVGYSDVHTFGKIFKKKTGSSLSQFCDTLFTEDEKIYRD
jgi:AraC-like DNA-binding protein